jgi:hypothetical protein
MTAYEGFWHLLEDLTQHILWLAAILLGGSVLLNWIKARQCRPEQRLILLSHLVRHRSEFRSQG